MYVIIFRKKPQCVGRDMYYAGEPSDKRLYTYDIEKAKVYYSAEEIGRDWWNHGGPDYEHEGALVAHIKIARVIEKITYHVNSEKRYDK